MFVGLELTDPEQLFDFVKRDSSEGRYYCSLCLTFSHVTKTCVRNHVESKHFDSSFLYSCDMCQESFSNKTSLNNHKSRKHKARAMNNVI